MGLRHHVDCEINASARDREAPNHRMVEGEPWIHHGQQPNQRRSNSRQEGTHHNWWVGLCHYYKCYTSVNQDW